MACRAPGPLRVPGCGSGQCRVQDRISRQTSLPLSQTSTSTTVTVDSWNHRGQDRLLVRRHRLRVRCTAAPTIRRRGGHRRGTSERVVRSPLYGSIPILALHACRRIRVHCVARDHPILGRCRCVDRDPLSCARDTDVRRLFLRGPLAGLLALMFLLHASGAGAVIEWCRVRPCRRNRRRADVRLPLRPGRPPRRGDRRRPWSRLRWRRASP